jgi:hypothetical protein
MLALRELQTRVRTALLGGDAGAVGQEIVGDGLDPAARLAVYRNHVVASLTAALESIYPVVARLVDVRFFRYAADAYVREAPPTGPCLFEYGGTFPEFLARFPAARSLAYLPDVARLEWAMNVALHAPDAPPLEPGALRALPPVALHPSVTLLPSPCPLDSIWRAHQATAPERVVDLAAGSVRLQVWRADDEVVFRELAPVEFAFREALARTTALAAAAEAALGVDPAADLTALVRDVLDEGVVVAG